MVYTVNIPLGLVGILHSTRTDAESIAVTALITGGLGAVVRYIGTYVCNIISYIASNRLYLLQLSLLQQDHSLIQ